MLTAYCGICCADCMPSCEELFALVDGLDQLREQLRFDQYEELKSSKHKEFEDYLTFLSVLSQIKELRCPSACWQGGGLQLELQSSPPWSGGSPCLNPRTH
jgi:hypothetical protein